MISGIPDVGLCDLTERECALTSILGLNFVDTPTLSCGIKPFQVYYKRFVLFECGNLLYNPFTGLKCYDILL